MVGRRTTKSRLNTLTGTQKRNGWDWGSALGLRRLNFVGKSHWADPAS